MFENGREYTFCTSEAGDVSSWTGEIISVEMPHIKVHRSGKDIVFNTLSAHFHSAEILPYRSPEQKSADKRKWEDLINREADIYDIDDPA